MLFSPKSKRASSGSVARASSNSGTSTGLVTSTALGSETVRHGLGLLWGGVRVQKWGRRARANLQAGSEQNSAHKEYGKGYGSWYAEGDGKGDGYPTGYGKEGQP